VGEGLTQHDAWERVKETFRRYEDATLRLPLESPELRLYRHEYMAALEEHYAILMRLRLPAPPQI
jgi:hypothetical protein